MAVGEDIRGGQPTGGNIKGGLTTIEEKSLGAIAKAGSAPIQAVYEYGEFPEAGGLVVMDSPGREPEILTGLAAAGANVIVFATGRGAPQGFPFVPVIKITGSQTAAEKMIDHIDMNLAAVIDGDDTIPDAGKRVLDRVVSVASGEVTKAELSGYFNAMDIFMQGPVLRAAFQRNIVDTGAGSGNGQQIGRKRHIMHGGASDNNSIGLLGIFCFYIFR